MVIRAGACKEFATRRFFPFNFSGYALFEYFDATNIFKDFISDIMIRD